MGTWDWVNIGTGNDLLPHKSKTSENCFFKNHIDISQGPMSWNGISLAASTGMWSIFTNLHKKDKKKSHKGESFLFIWRTSKMLFYLKWIIFDQYLQCKTLERIPFSSSSVQTISNLGCFQNILKHKILGSEQNGLHLADSIYKCLNKLSLQGKISLKCITCCLIDQK